MSEPTSGAYSKIAQQVRDLPGYGDPAGGLISREAVLSLLEPPQERAPLPPQCVGPCPADDPHGPGNCFLWHGERPDPSDDGGAR